MPTGSKLVVHKPTTKTDSGLVDPERAKMAWNMMREEALSMKDMKVPWRGPREKSVGFMTTLIEILTVKDNIVMDWQCGTGWFLPLFNFWFYFQSCNFRALQFSNSIPIILA